MSVRRLREDEIISVLNWIELLGVETTACRKAKVSLANFRYEREQNADFDAQVTESLAMVADFAEIEAYRRAFKGVEKPVWYKGEQVGTEIEYSDTLAITMLKALRPEKYKERKEVTGKNNGQLEVVIKDFNETDLSSNVRQTPANTAKTQQEAQNGEQPDETGKRSAEREILIRNAVGAMLADEDDLI